MSRVEEYAVHVEGIGWANYAEFDVVVGSTPRVLHTTADACELAMKVRARYEAMGVDPGEITIHQRIVTTTIGEWEANRHTTVEPVGQSA